MKLAIFSSFFLFKLLTKVGPLASRVDLKFGFKFDTVLFCFICQPSKASLKSRGLSTSNNTLRY